MRGSKVDEAIASVPTNVASRSAARAAVFAWRADFWCFFLKGPTSMYLLGYAFQGVFREVLFLRERDGDFSNLSCQG